MVSPLLWYHRWMRRRIMRRMRIEREKRRIACYFSSITGNKSDDFLRLINGEKFKDVFGKEPVDNRADSVKTEGQDD